MDPIGIAVLGAGHWGPNLIRIFHSYENSRVLWVADPREERLNEVQRRFQGVQVAKDSESVLEDPRVDAVVIATPSTTHYDLARRALLTDRHVLVEKPITTSAATARELCHLAAARGLVLMVGHVFLYNGAVRAAKTYISRGELGSIRFLSFVRTNLGPIRSDVNAAWDLAAHDISIANYWLDRTPVAVSAVGAGWIRPGVDDVVFATLEYPQGIVAHIHASWLNPRKVRDITVVGSDVMLTVDDINLSEPLRLYDKHVATDDGQMDFIDSFQSFRASIRDGAITIPRVTTGEPLRAECEDFLRSIRTGERPESHCGTGIDVLRALEAIDRSAAQGGARVPLEGD